MITFYIDELTPCIKNTITGDIIDTEVVRIKRKSFLSKFNRKTGWYINWGKVPEKAEIYALVIKGTMDIQGMVAVIDDVDSNAAYIHWACTAPHNNIWEYGEQKYTGVGGHLLAIVASKSEEWNHAGVFHADAMDKDILNHYISEYNAEYMPLVGRPYHFIMEEDAANNIMEVYTYDWTDDEV